MKVYIQECLYLDAYIHGFGGDLYRLVHLIGGVCMG